MTDVLWTLDKVRLGRAPAFRLADVTCTIGAGVTAVLGESGAGKTSFMNLLVGFENADGGKIEPHFGAASNSRLPLFWSPQDFGLWPHLSVREHLAAVSPGDVDAARVDELLRAFDLHDRTAARPAELSQGQRSRLSVARALASDARVLVMDEPLAHVDAARVDQFWAVIRGHVEAAGASLVFATHQPQTVLAEARRVICLDGGRMIYEGDVQTLFDTPPNERAARCLGETNWISEQDAAMWLSTDNATQPAPGGHAYHPNIRPHRLAVVENPQSPLLVESLRFRGQVTDVQLKHEQHQQNRGTRRFICGGDARRHKPGDRVSLRLVTLLIALLSLLTALTACDGGADARLDFENIHYHAMPPDEDSLPQPRAIRIGGENEIIVLDKGGRVLLFDFDGKLKRQWRMPQTQAGHPEGACRLKDGRIAVADTHYNRIVIFTDNGEVGHTFGTLGEGEGQFIYPVKVVQDDDGYLYVLEYGGNDRVQKFTVEGGFIAAIGSFGTAPGELSRPAGLLWHAGKLYIAEADNHRVSVFTDHGEFVEILTQRRNKGQPIELDFPYDLALGPDGLLYVVEYGGGRVTAMTLDGQLVGRFGQAGMGEGQFRTPWGIAADPRGHVWVADTGNRRIVELMR